MRASVDKLPGGPRGRRVAGVGCLLAVGLLASGGGGRAVAGKPPAGRAHGRLSTELTAALSSALGARQARFAVARHGDTLVARSGGLETTFSQTGPIVRAASGDLALRLLGAGRNGEIVSTRPAVPVAQGNRITYRHGAITEWYRNGPLGIEQGFSLEQRPAGTGPLTIAIGSSGLMPRLSGNAVTFREHGGQPLLRYGGLSAVDSAGRAVPSRLEVARGKLLLRVDDTTAHYPLTVDPFLQPIELVPGGTADNFGWSIAVSGSGNTAIIGAPGVDSNAPTAWIFVRSGSGWIEQGPPIRGIGSTNATRFGSSVALSNDGNTALIGAFAAGNGVGNADVFVRNGATWTPQQILTGSGSTGATHFGQSVALSGDGNTALIGGPGDNGGVGAAWVFTRSGTHWAWPRAPITASGETGAGGFGESVALSNDGTTALIGAPNDNGAIGAAWVFTQTGGDWGQQAGKLTGSGEIGPASMGFAVALSSDGTTALVGGFKDDGGAGAAWTFGRTGATWTQLGGKLTEASTANGFFGYSAALSANGATALIGAPGFDNAAWVFTRSGTAWTQNSKLTAPSSNTQQGLVGQGVALASDGKTALVGAAASRGAVFVYVNRPLLGSTVPVVPRKSSSSSH